MKIGDVFTVTESWHFFEMLTVSATFHTQKDKTIRNKFQLIKNYLSALSWWRGAFSSFFLLKLGLYF